MTSLKLENTELRKLIATDDTQSEAPSNLTDLTRLHVGRPEIEAVSAVSFDIRLKKPSLLDSEVKARGMDKFAKVTVPSSHLMSGRGRQSAASSKNQSGLTNMLSESSFG